MIKLILALDRKYISGKNLRLEFRELGFRDRPLVCPVFYYIFFVPSSARFAGKGGGIHPYGSVQPAQANSYT